MLEQAMHKQKLLQHQLHLCKQVLMLKELLNLHQQLLLLLERQRYQQR